MTLQLLTHLMYEKGAAARASRPHSVFSSTKRQLLRSLLS